MDWATFNAMATAWAVAPLNNMTFAVIVIVIYLGWIAERRRS